MKQPIIKQLALAMSVLLCVACSHFDLRLPEGPEGKQGIAGASAYDTWKTEVLAGRIPWTSGLELSDFFRYLKGKDGRDGSQGLSAFEQWQALAHSGSLLDPKTGEAWERTHDSEAHFWYFLSGRNGERGANGERGQDGSAGANGKSAYELWREELQRRYRSDKPMRDPKTGEVWALQDDSLDDFFRYLSGRDGRDGKNGVDGKDGRTGSDGRPTPPGTAGDTVVIVIGKPNVIAQYSIQAQSEYILPEGVRYKVYWEDGELAPHAVVKGLPGMDAEKTFTADEKGEFVIPMADLPFADEISFGRAESVSYKGKTARSAHNTYVPNKFLYEFEVLNQMKFIYADRMQGTMSLRVKRAPSKSWERLPLYFQKSTTKVHAYRISDPKDPHSFVLDEQGEKIKELWPMDYHLSYVVPYRPVIESKRAPRGKNNFWDGKPLYFLCDFNFGSFPGLIREAFIIEVPPIQYAPRLKSIHLKTKRQTEGGVSYFESISGEIDTSDIDLTKLYSVYKRSFSSFAGGKRMLFPALTAEEVARLPLYVHFRYNAGEVSHHVTSSPKHPTLVDPSYRATLPYVGSAVSVDFDWSSTSGLVHNVSWLPDYTGGTLKYAPNGTDFLVTFDANKYPNLQPISVSYED